MIFGDDEKKAIETYIESRNAAADRDSETNLTYELDKKTLESLATNLTAGRPELSRSERMLGRLWRLSRTPVAARLISVIPFRMQRAIKRRFSSRPMHDIVGRQ